VTASNYEKNFSLKFEALLYRYIDLHDVECKAVYTKEEKKWRYVPCRWYLCKFHCTQIITRLYAHLVSLDYPKVHSLTTRHVHISSCFVLKELSHMLCKTNVVSLLITMNI